ncbi:hypothetical protein G6F65_022062 [Rhizopus arrhizus]|nr:hypothetical protein G6F65_022062 [Rhizopus arrhizus]
MVFARWPAQPRVHHAAGEAPILHRHKAVHHTDLAQQIGIDEVGLRVAGNVGDLQVQVLAGRGDAVGRVHPVDLEQVLIGAGTVEGNVLHIHRAAVRRPIGRGIRAPRGVGGHQRRQVLVGRRRGGDLFLGIDAFIAVFAVHLHRVQAQRGKLVRLVDVDDVAARAVAA